MEQKKNILPELRDESRDVAPRLKEELRDLCGPEEDCRGSSSHASSVRSLWITGRGSGYCPFFCPNYVSTLFYQFLNDWLQKDLETEDFMEFPFRVTFGLKSLDLFS